MSWCWNDPVRVSLKSFISLPLSSEVWLHRMLSCGNTLQWDRHSEGLPDMLRSSAWGFGFLSSSWWARWTQPEETESSECLITYLAGAEATETVRAEQISLERFPGMKSMKAEIIPPSSRVVEKAGLEFLLSHMLEDRHGKKCSPAWSGLASSFWGVCAGHSVKMAQPAPAMP